MTSLTHGEILRKAITLFHNNIIFYIYFLDDIVEIGKITFKPSEVLGKGCEGTFV